MKVVFLQDVPNVARAGEVKEVANGYGRNFLIPKKLATLATPSELKRTEAQRQAAARHQVHLESEAEALTERLEGLCLTLKARVGAEDRLFGSITTSDIAKEILELTGYDIDKRKIEIEEPIKKLGSYEVSIRLSKDVTRKVRVIVEEA